MAKRPIATICPACSGKEFKIAKPDRFVAFANDRICKACGIGYRLPTPIWAGLVFAVIGLGMLLGGLVTVGVLLRHPFPNPIGLAINSCVAVCGALALWHGLKAIFQPGKV
ncbi:MAG: hypothetical protein ACJ8C4_04380 [Gemmataceae bacterium]